jgi:tetratricopeptide (TPR) repeat protein
LLAEMHRHLGITAMLRGRFGADETAWRKDLEICEGLARTHPTVPRYRTMRTVGRVNLGWLYLKTDRLDEADKLLREADGILAGLRKEAPEALRDFPYLEAVCRLHLGTLGVQRRRFQEAEPYLRQAFAASEQLCRDYPRVPDYPVYLLQSYSALHDIYKEGDPQALLDLSTRGIPVMEAWLKLGRNNEVASYGLTVMYATRALDGWTRLGRYREAGADWDAALRADPGKVRDVILVGRAFTLAHEGRHAAAAAEADKVLAGKGASAEALFMGGRTFAIASAAAATDPRLLKAERLRVANAHGARAVVLLRRAIDRGLTIFKEEARPAALRRDPDFASLQERDDFRDLLKSLDAKEKAAP